MIDVRMIDGPDVWVSTRVLERSDERILLGKWSDEGRTLFALELSRSGDGFKCEDEEYRLRRTDLETLRKKLT